MRIRLRLLGMTLVSLTVDPDQEPYTDESSEIGGGSAHNFERYVEIPVIIEPDERGKLGFR